MHANKILVSHVSERIVLGNGVKTLVAADTIWEQS